MGIIFMCTLMEEDDQARKKKRLQLEAHEGQNYEQVKEREGAEGGLLSSKYCG